MLAQALKSVPHAAKVQTVGCRDLERSIEFADQHGEPSFPRAGFTPWSEVQYFRRSSCTLLAVVHTVGPSHPAYRHGLLFAQQATHFAAIGWLPKVSTYSATLHCDVSWPLLNSIPFYFITCIYLYHTRCVGALLL